MPIVCWLCEYPTLLGGERSLLATLEPLRRRGYEVCAIAPTAGPLATALAEQQVRHVPLDLAAERASHSQAELRQRLASLLDRLRPDLLHANSLSMARLSGPVAAELGIASIGHLRDIVRLSRQAVADLNRHHRLLAVSRATRTFHVAQGVSAARTRVLCNGVDLSQFRPRPPSGWLHAELGLDPRRRLIAAVGQIIQRKGWLTLARAAQQVAAEDATVDFVLVGERYSQKPEAVRYEQQVRAALAAEPLEGRVHWLGCRDDVSRLLPECSLLVHAARQEPLGRVLLEAAASGLPVVATDVGGTREIFPPETASTRLVPPDDPQALAAAIRAVLGERALAQTLGQAARRRAERIFDIRLAALNLARHYERVLAGSAGR